MDVFNQDGVLLHIIYGVILFPVLEGDGKIAPDPDSVAQPTGLSQPHPGGVPCGLTLEGSRVVSPASPWRGLTSIHKPTTGLPQAYHYQAGINKDQDQLNENR